MADDQQQGESIGDQQDGEQVQAVAGAGGADDNDVSKLKAALDKERDLRARYERESKQLAKFKADREKADQERQRAELSEVEKRDLRIKEMEGQLTQAQQRERSYALRDAIEEAVSTEKVALVAPVGRLLRLIEADAVDWADDGTPKNAATLVKALVKSDPYLFAARRAPIGDGGAGREGGVGNNVNDMIRRMSGRTA